MAACSRAPPCERPTPASPFPSPLSGEVSGWVTELDGTAFSLDTCAAGTGCSPEVYRFAIDSPDLTVTLPLGRQVTATWLLSSVVGRACRQELVVSDGLPSTVASGTWPALWLAGADSTIESSIPVPFSVVQQALSCNPSPSPTHPCGGAFPLPTTTPSCSRRGPATHRSASPREKPAPSPSRQPLGCSSTSRFTICARTRPRTAMTTGTGGGGQPATSARVDSSIK